MDFTDPLAHIDHQHHFGHEVYRLIAPYPDADDHGRNRFDRNVRIEDEMV